jgi:spoIIIJ-associated protein
MQSEGTTKAAMNDPKRRFFSGDSLQQALVQAANHYNLPPEEIAYRSLEKRHGFLKVRRKVVIEVNPDAPKREKAAPAPPAPHPPPPARPVPPPEEPIRSAPAERPAPSAPDRSERRIQEGRHEPRRRAAPARSPREAEPRRPDPGSPAGPSPGSSTRAAQNMQPGPRDGLVTLPDTPRRPAERFPEASGPMAEAATKGAELLLRIAGLELVPRVLQGEDRLEVDLSGADVDWCFSDDGELVMAIEHLLPRLIRSMSSEATLVRVDCDNFQEIREERLRSLAQQVAEELRRRGKPRTLEPMNPADRRIVHMTLADDPGVMTESEGDGYFKRISVRPV